MGSLHPRSLTWLSAASALGALVFGTWLLVRDGGRLSDGVRGYSAEDAPRYATWGAPRPAPYGNADGATRAALSRDGRWLAWSRPAEDGAGGEDLYLAEVREGRAGVGVRIDGLCTESDENGPAFGDAFIYFASNRPSALGEGGGFDLWRASFEDGVVGEPEPVPGPANSPADELDPAPLSGETELVFSRVS